MGFSLDLNSVEGAASRGQNCYKCAEVEKLYSVTLKQNWFRFGGKLALGTEIAFRVLSIEILP